MTLASRWCVCVLARLLACVRQGVGGGRFSGRLLIYSREWACKDPICFFIFFYREHSLFQAAAFTRDSDTHSEM